MMAKELSEKVGISFQNVSNYINGRRRPSLPTIEAFAEALRVSPSWLAGFIDMDTRNNYVMRDNPEETIYIHPSQYVITKIEDNGNKITLKKIQKGQSFCLPRNTLKKTRKMKALRGIGQVIKEHLKII